MGDISQYKKLRILGRECSYVLHATQSTTTAQVDAINATPLALNVVDLDACYYPVLSIRSFVDVTSLILFQSFEDIPGAYGQALLAEKNGKQYVLKEVVLSGRSRADQEDAAKEVKILRMVKHFNIIMYYDSAVVSGSLWIVMELAKDGDLFELVDAVKKKKRVIMEPQFLGMFVQIVLAIHYLHHEHHILHRDLKSKNIFLGGHKQVAEGVVVPVVKVGDFGIAKMLDGSMELAKTQIGTPYYLSPEICRDQPYGRKSDIWAMGCLLYEMMALRVPFNGKDLRSLAAEILKRRTPSLPRSHKKNVELGTLVNKLLEKHADDRPTTTEVLETPYLSNQVSFWLAVANGQEPSPIIIAPPKSGRGAGAGRRRQLPKTPVKKEHSSSAASTENDGASANSDSLVVPASSSNGGGSNDGSNGTNDGTNGDSNGGSNGNSNQSSNSSNASGGGGRRSKSPRRTKKVKEEKPLQNGGGGGKEDWIGMLREKSNTEGAGPAVLGVAASPSPSPAPTTPRRQHQSSSSSGGGSSSSSPQHANAGGYTPTPTSPTSPTSSDSSSSPGRTPGGRKRRQWNKPERVDYKRHPDASQSSTVMVKSPSITSAAGSDGGDGGGGGGGGGNSRYGTDSPPPPMKPVQVRASPTRSRTVSTASSSPSTTLPWDQGQVLSSISPEPARLSAAMPSPPPPITIPHHQKEADRSAQYTPVAINGPDGVPIMALQAKDGTLIRASVTSTGSVVPVRDGRNQVVNLAPGPPSKGGAVPGQRPERRVSDGWGADREQAKQSYFDNQAQAAHNRRRAEQDLGRGGGGGGGGGGGRQQYLGAPQTPPHHGRRSPGRGGRSSSNSSSSSNAQDLGRTAELAKAAHEAYFANQQAAARYQQRHQEERNGNGAAAAVTPSASAFGGGGTDAQPYSPSQGQGRGTRGVSRTQSSYQQQQQQQQQQQPPSRQPSYGGEDDGKTPADRARARKARAREAMIQEQQAALERARKQTYIDKQEIKRKHGTPIQKPAQTQKKKPTMTNNRASPSRSNAGGTVPERWGSQADSGSSDLSLTRTISKSDPSESLVASNDIAALEREIRKDVERLVVATESATKSARRAAASS